MGKKVKVKTKTTIKPKGERKPVKPNMSGDAGLLSEKIVMTVNKKKAKNAKS